MLLWVVEQHQIVQRALVDAVQARLVAVQQGEFRRAGIVAEGRRDAAGFFAFGLILDALVERGRLDGPGAAHAPECRYHLLHDAKFNPIGRNEALQVLLQQGLKCFRRLVIEHHDFRQQAVAGWVPEEPALAGGPGALSL